MAELGEKLKLHERRLPELSNVPEEVIGNTPDTSGSSNLSGNVECLG
jgi:hypothetical protein